MSFKWEQKRREKGETIQQWVLIHKETGKAVLQISLSDYAEQKDNCKIRNKIQKIYEIYFNLVYFQNINFF